MSLSLPVMLVMVFALGGLLLFSASKATSTIEQGTVFVRWMILAFVAYAGLVSIPLAVGF
jgi:hypothetical protein